MKAQAVQVTAKLFCVSDSYVRLCLSNTSKGGRSEEIKRHFNQVYNSLQLVLQKFSND